jgi:hypothetical protein
MSRSSAGKSPAGVLTLIPMPSTAQPCWGRPSTRIPASFRPSTRTSLGHLIRHSAGTASATATAAASGSDSGGSRTTTDTSTAEPGRASQLRP